MSLKGNSQRTFSFTTVRLIAHFGSAADLHQPEPAAWLADVTFQRLTLFPTATLGCSVRFIEAPPIVRTAPWPASTVRPGPTTEPARPSLATADGSTTNEAPESDDHTAVLFTLPRMLLDAANPNPKKLSAPTEPPNLQAVCGQNSGSVTGAPNLSRTPGSPARTALSELAAVASPLQLITHAQTTDSMVGEATTVRPSSLSSRRACRLSCVEPVMMTSSGGSHFPAPTAPHT